MTYLKFNGTETELHRIVSEFGINSNQASEIFTFLLNNDKILEPDEFIRKETTLPKPPNGFIGMMFIQTSYHINIKITTLVISALVLDIALTEGVASTILNLCGISGTAIIKLRELNGEKCIVKETILSDSKIGNAHILSKFHGECCNNNINCSFRKSDKCTCNEDDIIQIYERLTSSGVFKKEGTNYKYQW